MGIPRPLLGKKVGGRKTVHNKTSIPSQMILIWLRTIRQNLSIPLADRELIYWLSRYRSGFTAAKEEEITEFLTEFVSALQSCGTSQIDVIQLLFYIGSSIQNPTAAQAQPSQPINSYSEINCKQIYPLSKTILHLIDQQTLALSKQQNTTATLLRVASAVNSSLNLEKVLSIIAREITHLLDAEGTSSFLFPERSKYGNYYLLDPEPGYIVPDPPELFTLDALNRKEPVTCYDAALDPRTDKYTVQYFKLKSLMAFPLMVERNVVAVGLVTMKDYHQFTPDEINLVMGIANSAAMAVANAHSHEMSLQLAVAQERNRMSQEIHDELAQSLAITKINLSTILQNQPDGPTRATLLETKGLIDTAYTDLRECIFGLREISDLDNHLAESLGEYITTFMAHSGIETHMAIDELDYRVLSSETVYQTARIIEEALSNIRKHSQAKQAWISSNKDDKTIRIIVEDDGIGISADGLNSHSKNHFGVKIMNERAESVGAQLSIDERPGGGTRICIAIPYQGQKVGEG
jgi:signal transduction histidine kinase